jgi:hypothetical protein
MAISDVLSAAVREIRRYLDDPEYSDVYEGECRERIEAVAVAMDALRVELDTPPVAKR